MSSKLGPIEICCDAPAYSVVRACGAVGIHSPEDVRWLRVAHHRDPLTSGKPGLFWRLWGMVRRVNCTCGQPLPHLRQIAVVYMDGHENQYLVGQCGRCRTVFWDTVEE